MLLEPHLVETRRGCGLEIGYRHQTVDIIGGDTAAVNLEGIHVKAETLPQAKLLHVGVKMHVEHPVIGDALLEPTPVAESPPALTFLAHFTFDSRPLASMLFSTSVAHRFA